MAPAAISKVTQTRPSGAGREGPSGEGPEGTLWGDGSVSRGEREMGFSSYLFVFLHLTAQ